MTITINLEKNAAIMARLNESVQTLHHKLYPGYFKPYCFEAALKFYEAQISEEDWFCLVARDGEAPVGYCLFFIRRYKDNPFRKAYVGISVDQICVLPEYKGKGVGKALMQRIHDFALDHGACQLELTYWEENEEAKVFYGKLGFRTNTRFVAKTIGEGAGPML